MHGKKVKQMLQDFLRSNEDFLINDVPIKQWIEWEHGISAQTYAKNFDSSLWWGGALDITILSNMLGIPIYVYDYKSGRLMSDSIPKSKSNLLPYIALCFVHKCHYMHVRFLKH
jgi:hypothetical protein